MASGASHLRDVSRPARLLGLDAARGFAVAAMVFGHTLDAVLSSEARQTPGVQLYWYFRNFTAPLFLFISGWVAFWLIERKDLQGSAVLRRLLPRAGRVFLWGCALRLPLWNLRGWLSGERELWSYFLCVDALPNIALALTALALVCAAVATARLRVILLAALGITLALTATPLGSALAPGLLRQILVGTESNFPLFPWCAYLFAGAVTGWFVRREATPSALVLGTAAIVLLAGTCALSAWDLPRESAVKFAWRLGAVYVLTALALALPTRIAQRLAPVGRASLWTYVLHVPFVYGWTYGAGLATRVGRTLSAPQGVALAVTVVALSIGVALLAQRGWSRLRQLSQPRRPVLPRLQPVAPSEPPLRAEPQRAAGGTRRTR